LVKQGIFYNYLMPGNNDVPSAEMHAQENHANGESLALPPFASALTESIFDLTGKGIRKFHLI
jgi:CO/xanthine dehydrogenase Mo-binding subunit